MVSESKSTSISKHLAIWRLEPNNGQQWYCDDGNHRRTCWAVVINNNPCERSRLSCQIHRELSPDSAVPTNSMEHFSFFQLLVLIFCDPQMYRFGSISRVSTISFPATAAAFFSGKAPIILLFATCSAPNDRQSKYTYTTYQCCVYRLICIRQPDKMQLFSLEQKN